MRSEWPIASALWAGDVVEQDAGGEWTLRDRFGRHEHICPETVERELDAGIVAINDVVGPKSAWPHLWPATDLGASDDAVSVLRYGPAFEAFMRQRVESVGRQRAVFADLLDRWIDGSTISRKALARHLRCSPGRLNEVLALQVRPLTEAQCVRAAEYLGRDPAPLLEAREGSLEAW
ncbi:MAG: hypothetical protein AAFV77_09500 [Planctomycetota bacterium]